MEVFERLDAERDLPGRLGHMAVDQDRLDEALDILQAQKLEVNLVVQDHRRRVDACDVGDALIRLEDLQRSDAVHGVVRRHVDVPVPTVQVRRAQEMIQAGAERERTREGDDRKQHAEQGATDGNLGTAAAGLERETHPCAGRRRKARHCGGS